MGRQADYPDRQTQTSMGRQADYPGRHRPVWEDRLTILTDTDQYGKTG